jgi:hypothetical protein
MARAVIQFKSNIGPLLPELCQAIPGCVYNPATGEAVFNAKGQIVNIESHRITILDSVKPADAHELMQWLQSLEQKLIKQDD